MSNKKDKLLKVEQNREKRPHASVRYVRIAPDKVRVVLNVIRGKAINEALAILDTTPKSASPVIAKLIRSAAANAEHNNDMSRHDLVVAECFADGGPVFKRFQPVSKGRAHHILKRTSHITVILDKAKEAN